MYSKPLSILEWLGVIAYGIAFGVLLAAFI